MAPTLIIRPIIAAVLAALVCACAGRPPTAGRAEDRHAAGGAPPERERAAARHDYVDPEHGLRIAVPAGVRLRRGFAGSYLDSAEWKAYARPGSRGEALVALQLPGSDRITMAELRIGASSDAAEVRRCAEPPDAATGPAEPVTVGGVAYRRFAAQDAGMSHYLVVEAYRTVRAGRCYAVDLLVYGTDPRVYTPAAKSPFTVEEGLAGLRRLMDGLRFDPRVTDAPASRQSDPPA